MTGSLHNPEPSTGFQLRQELLQGLSYQGTAQPSRGPFPLQMKAEKHAYNAF